MQKLAKAQTFYLRWIKIICFDVLIYTIISNNFFVLNEIILYYKYNLRAILLYIDFDQIYFVFICDLKEITVCYRSLYSKWN